MLVNETNTSKKKGSDFLGLSLYAFAGLGLEILLGLIIEPLVYGKGINNFSAAQSIVHWIFTCIIWSVVSYLLIRASKRKYNFDIFSYKDSIGLKDWIICFLLLAVCIIISVIDWHGSKVVKEFLNNGWLKFIFQYIYYLFETVLVVLIIAFSQKAGEIWFKETRIPWGGIFAGLTWGLMHMLTKGELFVGILTCLVALLYGIVYLVCRKNLRIAYPLIFLMFVL